MPTGVYVRKNAVSDRLKAGMAADHAAHFAQWLRERHYTPLTIIERMRLLASWTHWARAEGYTLATIREAHAAAFSLIAAGHSPRFPGDVNKDAVEVAKLFITHLEDRGVLTRLPAKPEAPLVVEFAAWAREQRGLAEATLGKYLGAIAPFVDALGDAPAAYDAEAIRAHMTERAKTVSVERMKGISVGIRAFLRFLIATGRCPPGLDHAMPNFAGWRLASIPRFLPDADIARIIGACDGERRLRDRAIILLLVRLGLRASEVARLTFDDINWRQGTIRLCGKSRREELLPLTQEIGDALLAYIKRGRPALVIPSLFITECAPLRPIDRVTVKCLVKRALKRGGVESRYKGAHILRHSAATAMLRHGVSLPGVSTVLRHRSLAMTMHYAKVDIALLSTIAQPWPGRSAC
jgi:integrase/recombinase XerD